VPLGDRLELMKRADLLPLIGGIGNAVAKVKDSHNR